MRSVVWIIGLGLLIGLLYTTLFQSAPSPAETLDVNAYRRKIVAQRTAKDWQLRNKADSPISDKKAFNGLHYFEPDPAYRVTARLEPFADKTQKLVVKMSDGTQEVYQKWAHAVFRLQDETCRLLIVRVGDTYSLLFRDATSGRDTYGGGRYIDLDPKTLTQTQTTLDFNTAYNPYCAYNPTYACPLPPAENTLKVAVKAGERYVSHP